MHYYQVKKVDVSADLPADILSAYLRHTISVTFDSSLIASSSADTITFDQLVDWCNHNCDSVFAANKWAHNAAYFRFYLVDDLNQFQDMLSQTVALDHNPAAQ